MKGLVTDRTQTNVSRLKELAAKGWSSMTADEQSEWLGSPLSGSAVNLLPYAPYYSSSVTLRHTNDAIIASTKDGGSYLYAVLIVGNAAVFSGKTMTLSAEYIGTADGGNPKIDLYWHDSRGYEYAGASLSEAGSVTFTPYVNTYSREYLAMYIYVTADSVVEPGAAARFRGVMLEFGIGGEAETYIVDPTTMNFSNSSMLATGLNAPITAGKTYIVLWNGVYYDCTAFEFLGVVYLGNGFLVKPNDLSDTSEPFAIQVVTDTVAYVTRHTIFSPKISFSIQEKDAAIIRHEYVPYTEILPTDTTKGAYNYSDLNRVERTVAELSVLYGLNLETKTDWGMWDVPQSSDMVRYITNVKRIRQSVLRPNDLPAAPDGMNGLNYSDANNIEKILLAAHEHTDRIYRVGELFSGEVMN